MCIRDRVTPANLVSEWSLNTLEQSRIQSKLLTLGVEIVTAHGVCSVNAESVTMDCVFTGYHRNLACDAVTLVTSRLPNDGVWQELKARQADWGDAGIRRVDRIGDAVSPAPIAWAVYAGHRFAREIDVRQEEGELPFRREVAELAPIGEST